jgi:hypothetical protein
MNEDTEKRVLATLYDRLFDAICYAPEGKPGAAANKNTSRLLMAKNLVVFEKDFTNALSPLNPGAEASSPAAKAFSDLVDPVPLDGVEWIDSNDRISNLYPSLVQNANAKTDDDPEQKRDYELARKYLYEEVETKNVRGITTKTNRPTQVLQTYIDNETAYATATVGYRTAYNGYDLSKPADQRLWNAVEPGLNNTLQQAWNKWIREAKAEIEEAQQMMQTTINNAVKAALVAAQARVQPANRQAQIANSGPWFLSYAQPSNWLDWQLQGPKLTLRSEYLSTTRDSNATTYAAGGSGFWGLWNFGGKTGRTEKSDHARMDASKFSLEAQLTQVRIVRPWYDPQVLSMEGWYTNGYHKGKFADKMPLVASSMIVARNVKITADFTANDRAQFEKSTNVEAGIGWGPFSVSGRYQSSEAGEKFNSKFEGGSLELPGHQIIGFVCARTLSCPPMEY